MPIFVGVMKKIITFLILVAVVPAVCFAKLVLPTDTVRPDGMFNSYVVYGAEPSGSVLNSGNFILPCNIIETAIPDSELQIMYVHSGAISTAADKALIFQLFPEAQTFVVNGDTLSRCEFADVPVALLNSAKSDDNGAVMVDMRPSVHDISSAYRAEQDEEYVWLEKHKSQIPPLDFQIYEVARWPDDAFISVDHLLRTRNFAASIPSQQIRAFRVSMYGNRPHFEIFTEDRNFGNGHVPDDTTIIPLSKPSSLSLADILAELPANPRKILITPGIIFAN